jgi:hypothetical protein
VVIRRLARQQWSSSPPESLLGERLFGDDFFGSTAAAGDRSI